MFLAISIRPHHHCEDRQNICSSHYWAGSPAEPSNSSVYVLRLITENIIMVCCPWLCFACEFTGGWRTNWFRHKEFTSSYCRIILNAAQYWTYRETNRVKNKQDIYKRSKANKFLQYTFWHLENIPTAPITERWGTSHIQIIIYLHVPFSPILWSHLVISPTSLPTGFSGPPLLSLSAVSTVALRPRCT